MHRIVSVLIVGVACLAAGCGGGNTAGQTGSASFLGRAGNAAIFIEWTRSGTHLTGSLEQALVNQPPATGVATQSVSFSGTVAGSGLTLQLNRGLGSTTALVGQFHGVGFTLTYPGTNNNLIQVDFKPAQVSDYNDAVAALGSQAATPRTRPSTTRPSGTASKPQVLYQINLRSPTGSPGAVGVVNVVGQLGKRALAIVAQGLAPTTRTFAYAVWLYNSSNDAHRLGFAPAVSGNGRLQAVAALPSDTSHFNQMIITRETTANPMNPGAIVLSGQLRP